MKVLYSNVRKTREGVVANLQSNIRFCSDTEIPCKNTQRNSVKYIRVWGFNQKSDESQILFCLQNARFASDQLYL